MTYTETIEFLYKRLPVFHREGKKAFKPSLASIQKLCQILENPHECFKSIHVAGTNGKGSSSNFLAAILQSAGYKVGLYTSPHLKNFTERIKINGEAIAESYVVDFVEKIRPSLETIEPSFFELTVALAFYYFAEKKVDIAVIEVGLGGRLDSTNVISPEISLITNIGIDHADILGDTLAKIAYEKAGIIKPNTIVVVGERNSATDAVFMEKALTENAPIFFAEDFFFAKTDDYNIQNGLKLSVRNLKTEVVETIVSELTGKYQTKNILGVLTVVEHLNTIGWNIGEKAIKAGIENTVKLTHLKGRWQQLSSKPFTVCDTAHNSHGIAQIMEMLHDIPPHNLHFVLGFVKDKDIQSILAQFPKEAMYYFCEAKQSPRALAATELQEIAKNLGIDGVVIENVNEAIALAQKNAKINHIIYVGGSTFVVAEIENL